MDLNKGGNGVRSSIVRSGGHRINGVRSFIVRMGGHSGNWIDRIDKVVSTNVIDGSTQ